MKSFKKLTAIVCLLVALGLFGMVVAAIIDPPLRCPWYGCSGTLYLIDHSQTKYYDYRFYGCNTCAGGAYVRKDLRTGSVCASPDSLAPLFADQPQSVSTSVPEN